MSMNTCCFPPTITFPPTMGVLPMPLRSQNDDFAFVSGCRSVQRSRPQQNRPKKNSKKYNTGLVCTVPGCEVKTDFKRKFELQRHMLKHQRETAFNCPVINCNRRGVHSFYREDKVKAHLRAAHEDDDIAKCPCEGCAAELMPLDLLAVHAAEHPWDTESKIIASYAKDMRKCPMPKCRRWVKVSKIAGASGHLHAQHDEAERVAQAPLLWSHGYDAFSCHIICPCCRWRCPDLGALRRHVEEQHCADELMSAEHIVMYGGAVRRLINELPWYMQSLHKEWPVWEKLPYEIKDVSFTCPGCAIVFDSSNYWAADGHASVMGTPEILYRYRRDILRLLPCFASHPVFDDIRRCI